MKILSFYFLCLLFFSGGVYAQQKENWVTYMTSMDGKPGSMMVDMGLDHMMSKNKLPYLVITGPLTTNCDSAGMPGKDEIGRMEEMLTATTNYISGVTPRAVAGTFTHNCRRLNYYYVKDTAGIRTAVARMYRRNFAGTDYGIKIKKDPGWDVYTKFLLPDELTAAHLNTAELIARMEKDSLAKPKNVRFNLAFASDTGREKFVNDVTTNGFKVERIADSKTHIVSYGLIISRIMTVTEKEMNGITDSLITLANKHDGGFYNWDITGH